MDLNSSPSLTPLLTVAPGNTSALLSSPFSVAEHKSFALVVGPEATAYSSGITGTISYTLLVMIPQGLGASAGAGAPNLTASTEGWVTVESGTHNFATDGAALVIRDTDTPYRKMKLVLAETATLSERVNAFLFFKYN